MMSVVFAPDRRVIPAETGANATIARLLGSMYSPATTTVRPKPKPVLTGSCSCWVVASRLPNIAKPTSSDAMLVSSTGLRVEVRMSTSGWLTRSSNGTQTTSTTRATRNRPSVRSLVQPQVPPLEMASSRLVRAIDSSTAPR